MGSTMVACRINLGTIFGSEVIGTTQLSDYQSYVNKYFQCRRDIYGMLNAISDQLDVCAPLTRQSGA